MRKICKKHFDQITTKPFIKSKFTSYKVNQNNTMYFSFFAIFLMVASFNFIQFAEAADDRTKLEAELVNPSTGKDDGKAKFEQRDDRTTFTVEIEGQDSDSVFEIRIDDIILGTFTTDDSGFADFNLDSRDGDTIPPMTSGSWVQVIDSNGNVVLSGKMIGTETIQDPNSQTPEQGSDPVATTNVIIPFGAKDKDVSEFYVPSTISVSLSETITWTNEDDTEHTVTSKSSGIFNSGLFGTRQSFSHQFTEDGTYEYFCQLHPWMVGTVIAGKGGDVSTPTPEPVPQPPSVPIPTPSPAPNSPTQQTPSQFTVTIPSGAAEQTIAEFYLPNSISVKVSDTILWKNSDIGFHTVTSGKGSPDGMFDSGLFGPGETFSRQFSSVGTIDYFCVVHPWMTGSISVTGPEKTNQNDESDSMLSPIKQMKKGIMAKDIQCKQGFDLILKISKEMGACVKPSSLPILVQRGWGQ
jgi:plastocyanin